MMIEAMVLLISEQPVPNYLSLLKFEPAYIYLLRTDKSESVTNSLVRAIFQRLPFACVKEKAVMPYDMNSTYKCCREICGQHKDLIVNVTGGTKLMAFGALRAGLENNTGLIYIETTQGHFLNLGSREINFPGGVMLPRLKIDDFIALAGAKVIKERTDFANMQKNFLYPLAINLVENSDLWWKTCNWFNRLRREHLKRGYFEGPYLVTEGRKTYKLQRNIIHLLQQAEVICDVKAAHDQVSFRVNPLYKRHDWIFKEGTPLELCAFYRIAELTEVDDVRLGVEYSWDAEDEKQRTTNELDILVSSHSRLTCISCKSGSADTNALTELNTYASNLGGTFANKIMLGADRMFDNDDFMERAKKMNIKTIHISEFMQKQFGINSIYKNN